MRKLTNFLFSSPELIYIPELDRLHQNSINTLMFYSCHVLEWAHAYMSSHRYFEGRPYWSSLPIKVKYLQVGWHATNNTKRVIGRKSNQKVVNF